MVQMECLINCADFGPPPDMILSMPPPPLPTFLISKNAVSTSLENETRPCFASFICEINSRVGDKGIEFIEISGNDQFVFEYIWLIILIALCAGVVLLATITTILLIKCRSFSLSYQDGNMKQANMSVLTKPKSNSLISTGIFYPCTSKKDSFEQQLANENRLLWATLTPHGTRHFISNLPDKNNHYETVNYKIKSEEPVTGTLIKSFDNNGFVDFDYEDPTPLMDSYYDELDSGYQETNEVVGSITKSSSRPTISSPTEIENPNIPPLNISFYKTSSAGTISKKTALGHRVSDASTFNS